MVPLQIHQYQIDLFEYEGGRPHPGRLKILQKVSQWVREINTGIHQQPVVRQVSKIIVPAFFSAECKPPSDLLIE
jgi:hypothetical protein